MLKRRTLIRCAAWLFWLLVWQLAAMALHQPLLFASPVQTLEALALRLPTAAFWASIATSGARICAGFLVALLGGAVLGVAAARWRTLRELLAPLMSVMKATPVACTIVLFLIWLGSERTCVVAVALVVLPAYYFCFLEAASTLDPARDRLFAAYGLGAVRRFLVSTWPHTVPYARATSANVVGMSWKSGVAAELIGMSAMSLGERVYQAKLLLETADLFAWTAVIVACAYVCELVFLRLLSASAPAGLALASWLTSRRVARSARSAEKPREVAPLTFEAPALTNPAGVVIARDVHVRVAPGEVLCVMGSSGVGKTTLLRAVVKETHAAGRTVSLVAQTPELIEAASIEVNGAVVAGTAAIPTYEETLVRLGVEAELARPAAELSGGQRRRVELARALVAPTELLVLDEPFAGLDSASHEAAAECLLTLAAGRPILLATHDPLDATLLNAQVLHLK